MTFPQKGSLVKNPMTNGECEMYCPKNVLDVVLSEPATPQTCRENFIDTNIHSTSMSLNSFPPLNTSSAIAILLGCSLTMCLG